MINMQKEKAGKIIPPYVIYIDAKY